MVIRSVDSDWGAGGLQELVLARILWVARVTELFAGLFCTFFARKRSVHPLAPPREMTDDVFRFVCTDGGGREGWWRECLLLSKQTMAACGCEKTWKKSWLGL